MAQCETPSDFYPIDNNIIQNGPWQNSTIEEQSNANDFACFAISPSQFRSLLSSRTNSASYARHILLFVRREIRSPRVLILIADEIQKYNVAVFEHKNEQTSLKVAMSLGQKIASFFSEALSELPLNDSQEIKIICWTDMLSSSNYEVRVQNIRQYIDNNQIECNTLINQVCKEYAQARNSRKHLKQKDFALLREYVINELPALLNGIEYEGKLYTFMLHPTLITNNYNGNDQRKAMVALLTYMREHYVSNIINANSMCHIFDVEIPSSLVMTNDESLTGSTYSSVSHSHDSNSSSSSTLQEPAENVNDNSTIFWSILFVQLTILFMYNFWLQIFFVGIFSYGLYSAYMLLIRKMSKRGEWHTTSNENGQQVLGTNYQSFFGDLPAIQSTQDGYLLNNLHASLGCPQVYRIWMGPEPALMLAHLEAVKEFWKQHNEKLVQRDVHLGWPLQMLMGYGVGFRSMLDRNRITKFFHTCFGPGQVRHFDAQLETIVTQFFNQHSFDVLQCHDIKYLAHDAAVHLFLGEVGFDYLDELHTLVDELGDLMIEAFNARWTNLPIIGYYLLPTSYKLRTRIRLFNQRIRNVLTKIIDIYRQSPSINNDDIDDKSNENTSLLAYFARDPNPSITFDELTDTIVEGLLAPNDGTAGTFMYTLLLLAMHPEIQEKTRQEIQTCADLSLKYLNNVTYLDQVLSECQRLFPIFMFNVPEFSSEAMTVGGIHIPKNTMIMLDVVSLNRNQESWGPDSLSFRPERFAPPVAPSTVKAYHGFGNGHLRRCLGQHLIKNLHRLFLAHLLSQKKIQSAIELKNINDIQRSRLPFIYVPTQSVQLVPL